MIGGQLLNLFTEFYSSDPKVQLLSPSDPNWIGAWWLGFLLIFGCSVTLAALISLVPAKLQSNDQQEDKENQTKPEKQSYSQIIQDIPKIILKLVTNFPFMGITLGATMDCFLLAGKFYFDNVMIYLFIFKPFYSRSSCISTKIFRVSIWFDSKPSRFFGWICCRSSRSSRYNTRRIFPKKVQFEPRRCHETLHKLPIHHFASVLWFPLQLSHFTHCRSQYSLP